MNKQPQAALARLFGIDVSHYQGDIDWKRVQKAGVQFAFIKATEGESMVDDKFAANIKNSRALGIPCGAYHFFIPSVSVQAQVDNFCNAVGSLQPGDLPPVLDVEVPSKWFHTAGPAPEAEIPAIWLGLTVEQRVSRIVEWMTAVEKRLGVTPILYLSPSFATTVLGSSPALKKYLLWLAHYGVSTPTIPAPWTVATFWQFSDKGTVDGTGGGVDSNWFNGTLSDLQALLQPKLALHHRIFRSARSVWNRFIAWILG